MSNGCRSATSIAATLAIGSPGADRITTALMQVLARALLRGEPLQTAVDAPRLHVRFMADGVPRVEFEPSDELAAAVAASGLGSHVYPGPHMYFGGVGAAELGERGLAAAGDARREAAVGLSA